MTQAPSPTGEKPKTYRGKRAFDLAIAIPALLVSSPVMLVVALLVRWRLGRPVLFRQVRPGLQGQAFTMYKFRTMRETHDGAGQLLPDADRLTRLGRVLRSTSLDELPELVNVIKGEMSVVGPRPLLMEYVDRYTPEQARRHETKPGITGWAQVNGRNALSWEEKFALDVWYVDHQSFTLDLRIISMTVMSLIRRQGINQPGTATAQLFVGLERNTEWRRSRL